MTELLIAHSVCSPAEVVNFLPNKSRHLGRNCWEVGENLPSFKAVGWNFSSMFFQRSIFKGYFLGMSLDISALTSGVPNTYKSVCSNKGLSLLEVKFVVHCSQYFSMKYLLHHWSDNHSASAGGEFIRAHLCYKHWILKIVLLFTLQTLQLLSWCLENLAGSSAPNPIKQQPQSQKVVSCKRGK